MIARGNHETVSLLNFSNQRNESCLPHSKMEISWFEKPVDDGAGNCHHSVNKYPPALWSYIHALSFSHIPSFPFWYTMVEWSTGSIVKLHGMFQPIQPVLWKRKIIIKGGKKKIFNLNLLLNIWGNLQ